MLRKRNGFTLMELLIVVAILALLAAVAIPRLIDVFERSRSGVQSYNLADAARMIETYYGVNKKYPDGWDSLIDETSGTIYANIHPNLAALLVPVTLEDDPATTIALDQKVSLNEAGIGHIFQHDATAGVVPSDSGTFRHHLGTGTGHDGTTNVVTLTGIDTTAGSSGYNFLVNDLGLAPNNSTTLLTNNKFVVFGFGPKNTAVQSVVQQAPFLDQDKASTRYSRMLAVFMVPISGGGKARLVGVLGPDGRGLADSIRDYNTDPQTTAPSHN
ncbi:MAG: prepilin-type N-terminal cleavage/methylation domain-containing protein [Gemmataceae bacterium]